MRCGQRWARSAVGCNRDVAADTGVAQGGKTVSRLSPGQILQVRWICHGLPARGRVAVVWPRTRRFYCPPLIATDTDVERLCEAASEIFSTEERRHAGSGGNVHRRSLRRMRRSRYRSRHEMKCESWRTWASMDEGLCGKRGIGVGEKGGSEGSWSFERWLRIRDAWREVLRMNKSAPFLAGTRTIHDAFRCCCAGAEAAHSTLRPWRAERAAAVAQTGMRYLPVKEG